MRKDGIVSVLHTWFVVQKDVNVQTVHVRRCGGSGRMSSLIQILETDCSSLGRRAQRLTAAKPMVSCCAASGRYLEAMMQKEGKRKGNEDPVGWESIKNKRACDCRIAR
jgi:hypothetical protein